MTNIVDIYNLEKKYEVIYADPAWEYKQKQMNFQNYDKGKKYSNHVTEHYNTMSIKELKEMSDVIKKITNEKSCLLFMWVTSPNLDVAIEVGKSWGFDYKTVAFVWDKQRTNYGFYTLSQIEMCLVFKKGKIPKKAINNIKQFHSEHVGKHSEKPVEFIKRISNMFPQQNKIELFARKTYKNWDCWGNQINEMVGIKE